jgi:hypothetical protein
MNRNSLSEMSGRVMHQIVRLTLNKGNDNPMMQEMSFDGMVKEGRKIVERMQSFGMSSIPMPRDEQEGGGQGGGGGGDVANLKGAAAEGIAVFLGGQRNHPVVLAVDDRRHRPMGMKPGESFQYDHQGQGTLIRNAATYIMSLDDNGDGKAPGGKMLRDAEGRATGKSEEKERFVSIRHVVKKKQDREKGGSPEKNLQTWADAGVDLSRLTPDELAEKASAPNHEDYKHEGDEVNTEMRASAKKIEFRTGDNVTGHYDKDAKEWQLNSGGDKDKSVKVDGNHAHIKIGGSSIWVDQGGCWSSKPIQLKADPSSTEILKDPLLERIERLEARIAELEARHGK